MNTIAAYQLTKRFTLGPKGSSSFLALDGLSFSTNPGEVVGIIGHNGAGKSTLLKILSRILRPTSGRVELRGRVGSLLEIGTGFHPELSGRENIFLSASILGMRHGEIVKKLDEIIAFADIGHHLDRPVKHYSSGMYMRLAFAVAAHIEPEILLLDEVLAVGDANFQKKCMERIAQVGKKGQTVLFVSHNIPAILRLCGRALLIERGRLMEDGIARDVAASYLRMREPAAERRFPDPLLAPGNQVTKLRGMRIRARQGETLKSIDIGAEFGIEMEFDVLIEGLVLFPAIVVNNEQGELFWSTDVSTGYHATARPAGSYRVIAWIPPNFLAPGSLTVTAAMYSYWPNTEHFSETNVVSFEATETDGGARGQFLGRFGGVVRPWLEWSVDHHPPVEVEWISARAGLESHSR